MVATETLKASIEGLAKIRNSISPENYSKQSQPRALLQCKTPYIEPLPPNDTWGVSENWGYLILGSL